MKPNDSGVNVSSLKSADVIQKEYRLDDVIISEAESFLIDPTTELVITLEEEKVTYNRFTNESKRKNWMINKPNGNQLDDLLEKGKILHNYAESIGAITEFENRGTLMAEYRQMQAFILKENQGPPNKSTFGAWYKYYASSGTSYPVMSKPFFGGDWNNNISSVAAIGGATIYYNKWFYGEHLLTIWHITPKNYFVGFYGYYIDNKTSSTLVL